MRQNRRGHCEAGGGQKEDECFGIDLLWSDLSSNSESHKPGLACMDDPAIRQRMESKFPARGHILPESVPKHCPVDHVRGLRDSWFCSWLWRDETRAPPSSGAQT